MKKLKDGIMYEVTKNFDFKDVLHLVKGNRNIVFGKFAHDENIPVSYFWRTFKWRLENLLNRSILRLALKNANGSIDCIVLVEKSGFDSKIFGLNAGKTSLIFVNPNVATHYPAELAKFFYEIKESAASLNLDVIFTRIGLEQLIVIQYFENVGAILTDVLLTFYYNNKNESNFVKLLRCARVEKANRNDGEELMVISRKAFKVNHFHGDLRLPSNKSDELYARWVSNAIKQPNSQVLVVRENGEIQGFILCRIEKISSTYGYGVIDLIAVKEEHRGKGLGLALVARALEWFSSYTRSVYVGTQASNYQAIRIYQKAGFKHIYSECDLHLWV